MSTINSFEDLECWKCSRLLIKNLIDVLFKSSAFVRDFPLRDQMVRSSGSIMDNIAEGFGRDNRADFILFLSYSKGSCSELKSQLYRAFDFGYITEENQKQILSQIDSVERQISAFRKYLKNSDIKGKRHL